MREEETQVTIGDVTEVFIGEYMMTRICFYFWHPENTEYDEDIKTIHLLRPFTFSRSNI